MIYHRKYIYTIKKMSNLLNNPLVTSSHIIHTHIYNHQISLNKKTANNRNFMFGMRIHQPFKMTDKEKMRK